MRSRWVLSQAQQAALLQEPPPAAWPAVHAYGVEAGTMAQYVCSYH